MQSADINSINLKKTFNLNYCLQQTKQVINAEVYKNGARHTNLAPCSIVGCCHLANLTAEFQSHSGSTL